MIEETVKEDKRVKKGIAYALLLALMLLAFNGYAEPVMATVLEHPAPSDFSYVFCEDADCFWNLPMGVLDEAAIWHAMMEPMTVLKGDQREILKIYEQPDTSSRAVGEVTCESQGLHILETLDNGWAHVEVYSSSASKSTVKVFAEQIQGYIKTDKFVVKEPDPTYGILIDKLTQTMYVFKEGKLLTELLISTGIPNRDEPYNETPAGEFMMVSRTGGFWSGNMYCDMGMRINAGILMHEVPCLIDENEKRNYKPFESALGRKASHGCIRIQGKENKDGINAAWLWKNLKVGTKVLIWDDVGRPIIPPDADTPMYYNPDGGQYYHLDQVCPSVRDKYLPLTEVLYGELDEKFPKLKQCATCRPPLKMSEIEKQNQ
jgi:Uncharacterized protein conserved in bacteria